MSVPCEVAVKCVLPAIRATVARRLVSVRGLKQVEAAKLLSVSQPAISLYNRNIRGKSIDLENDIEIYRLVSEMTNSLAENSISRRDLIRMYCNICKVIRAKGLLCKLHKTFDSLVDIENCELCSTRESIKCP